MQRTEQKSLAAKFLSSPARPSGLAGLAIVVCLLWAAPGAAEERPLWLAVTRPDLAGALKNLAEHRRKEGFDAVISTQAVDAALAAAGRRPAFLLLVGDDEPGKNRAPWYLPAKRRKLYRWRAAQRLEFASDPAWSDLDGDLVPDVPAGRIPARTGKQVAQVVAKILAYERREPTPEDLRLPIWAGSPNYGGIVDSLATNMLLASLRMEAADWVRPWIISSDPRHPLCGWPPDQPRLFSRQVKRGGVMAVLIGHAGPERFFAMRHGNKAIWFTLPQAEEELAKAAPTAPAVFFTCESGNFARSTPCMAESFVLWAGGPIAAIGATTESHPLTNLYSSLSLLRGLQGKDKRIGVLWLKAQRRAMRMRNPLAERLLRDVEGKLEDPINVGKLRRDQILMYALLGDPATRLKLPDPLTVTVQPNNPGWRWKVARPEGARRLHVGFRADWQDLPKPKGPLPEEQARSAFRTYNASLGFAAMPLLERAAPWEGTINKEGLLRLVATGGGRIHVAAVKLKLPTTRPAVPVQQTGPAARLQGIDREMK